MVREQFEKVRLREEKLRRFPAKSAGMEGKGTEIPPPAPSGIGPCLKKCNQRQEDASTDIPNCTGTGYTGIK